MVDGKVADDFGGFKLIVLVLDLSAKT